MMSVSHVEFLILIKTCALYLDTVSKHVLKNILHENYVKSNHLLETERYVHFDKLQKDIC